MAKSYVTKFVEYTEQNRKFLSKKLKDRGLTVSPQETLGSLISQIDLLRDDYKAPTYDRDPNLPDLDEMFDNDPLRAVNGGQYKGCFYALMPIDINGKVGLSYQSGTHKTMRNFAEKIIFGDGVEYEKTTTSALIHSVGENGIYTTTNGDKYTIVKFYKTEPVLLTLYLYLEPFEEMIDDFYIGSYYLDGHPAVSGYLITASIAIPKYYRYVGSNNTLDNIFQNSSTYWRLNYLYFCDHIRVEGLNRFKDASSIYNIKKMILSGTLYGENATASITSTIGASSLKYSQYLETLSLPYSENTVSQSLHYTGVKTLIIPDTRYTSFKFYAPNNLENLHIGANLQDTITISDTNYYSLKNVTVSSGAFGLNTSAITINFSKAYMLTRESVLNMFNNFADRTGKTANILSLPANVKSMMTDEEKLILTNKNWTLS